MKIIVDAFGGDNAPKEVLKGCNMAVDEFNDVEIILTGAKKHIENVAQENNIKLKKIEIVDCESVLPVCEDPMQILKKYFKSSMAVGLQLLSQGKGEAFISAGSTGGLIIGSSLIVKRIKGIKRAAIATIIPTPKGCYILIDSGANHECRPEMFLQFGLMGSIYMNKILKLPKPKVGILNIGVERTKGTELQKNAYELLEKSNINFVGNVEARNIPFGEADVVITDGFTGNVVLKYTEGISKYFSLEIKNLFAKNILTKLAGSIVYGGLKQFKKKMDYTEFGGAMLLGIKKPVIKAHGSSNAKAIKNAVRQAMNVVKNKTIDEIEESLVNLVCNEKNKIIR